MCNCGRWQRLSGCFRDCPARYVGNSHPLEEVAQAMLDAVKLRDPKALP